jgi:hypothetical protein
MYDLVAQILKYTTHVTSSSHDLQHEGRYFMKYFRDAIIWSLPTAICLIIDWFHLSCKWMEQFLEGAFHVDTSILKELASYSFFCSSPNLSLYMLIIIFYLFSCVM